MSTEAYENQLPLRPPRSQIWASQVAKLSTTVLVAPPHVLPLEELDDDELEPEDEALDEPLLDVVLLLDEVLVEPDALVLDDPLVPAVLPELEADPFEELPLLALDPEFDDGAPRFTQTFDLHDNDPLHVPLG